MTLPVTHTVSLLYHSYFMIQDINRSVAKHEQSKHAAFHSPPGWWRLPGCSHSQHNLTQHHLKSDSPHMLQPTSIHGPGILSNLHIHLKQNLHTCNKNSMLRLKCFLSESMFIFVVANRYLTWSLLAAAAARVFWIHTRLAFYPTLLMVISAQCIYTKESHQTNLKKSIIILYQLEL